MLNQGQLDHREELEPGNMKQVVVLGFLFDFTHESRIDRGKEELGGNKIVQFTRG